MEQCSEFICTFAPDSGETHVSRFLSRRLFETRVDGINAILIDKRKKSSCIFTKARGIFHWCATFLFPRRHASISGLSDRRRYSRYSIMRSRKICRADFPGLSRDPSYCSDKRDVPRGRIYMTAQRTFYSRDATETRSPPFNLLLYFLEVPN